MSAREKKKKSVTINSHRYVADQVGNTANYLDWASHCNQLTNVCSVVCGSEYKFRCSIVAGADIRHIRLPPHQLFCTEKLKQKQKTVFLIAKENYV